MEQPRDSALPCRRLARLAALFVAAVSFCLLASRPTALGQIVTNPIARWAFDEGSGPTALDSSSNNNAGTIIGATYTAGRFGSALSFNGSNNYVFASEAQSGGVTGSGLDMGTRDWTVAAWVKTTASGMVATKMGYVGGSNPDGWGISISGNGTL